MVMKVNFCQLFVMDLIPDPNKTGMDAWSYTILLPQLVTIVLTTFIIMLLSIGYYKRLKKIGPTDVPTGLVLFAEIAIKWVEKQVVDLMGPKYKFLTVYVMYLLLYVGIGNLMSVVGFDSLATAYTVPLSMGLVTFIGIYYFGIKYQKLMYFKKFIVNPLELLTQFVPLISISFRLFGNILGGTVIIALFTALMSFIWGQIPYIGPVDLLAGVFLPFLSIYFDVFDGLIQAYIFSILTIAYWAIEMHTDEKTDKEKTIKLKKHKKIKNVQNVHLNR
ncbi:ATP synthase subunit a [Spiroplasma poulsonii]|uniref:ATP synthase subunit a n=3 Tax=Spiroplasma poulsonii TaxID=2138 RepID=A0A2P6FFR2_9MOLU|nr:ATP synthase subunit a [Spiroplasma poulsonii]PQM32302.1 ATP synthase subunit a [Spiroplasma poulsonii]PWF94958.1 ATP synthase subunit a [Spiroplasma poulsonii]PWF97752.1 ATP synthase subunit a [Spiroplasma poulsonii]